MSYELTDFESQVKQRSFAVPVVVDFWARWCGPCKMLGPVLEKLAAEAGGRWELVKVETDTHQGLAGEYQISSIPAVKLFRHGRVVDEFVGFQSEGQIREWLAPHLAAGGAGEGEGEVAPANELEVAAEMIDDGRLGEARPLLERLLGADPARHAARLLFAEILLSDAPAQALEELGKIPAGADEHPHSLALGTIASAANRDSAGFAADPIREKLLGGLAAVRRRDWDAALEAFIEVTERRRKYADGLAAEVGKAIFRYLGVRHPIADKHYRRFSSVLNS